MKVYYRPIIQNDLTRPKFYLNLSNQYQWFDRFEKLERGKKPVHISADLVPSEVIRNLTSIRKKLYF